jgi:hypothetical protein
MCISGKINKRQTYRFLNQKEGEMEIGREKENENRSY